MRFRSMFTKTASPVVADFGASSVKLLQITGGETPAIVAAQSLEIPDEARGNTDRRFAFLAQELPGVLRQGGFQGRRIICSPASSHFIVQQTRIDPTSTLSADDQVRAEVAGRMNCLPAAVVARSFPIPGSERDRVTLAIAREDVMRHVDLLKRCRFDLVGVQPDQFPMLRAFDHLHRRAEDRTVVTMYVDAGWGAIKVAVARGTDLVFARIIPIGGRQFDEIAAATWGCTASAARIRRVTEEREALSAPAPAVREEPAPEQMSAILRAGAGQGRPRRIAGEGACRERHRRRDRSPSGGPGAVPEQRRIVRDRRRGTGRRARVDSRGTADVRPILAGRDRKSDRPARDGRRRIAQPSIRGTSRPTHGREVERG